MEKANLQREKSQAHMQIGTEMEVKREKKTKQSLLGAVLRPGCPPVFSSVRQVMSLLSVLI